MLGLEGIGAYLINYYLGEFLENINYDQFKVQSVILSEIRVMFITCVT